jgi:uncharacterized protein YndB with AHSA1/START domain
MNIVKEADVNAPPEKLYEYLLDFSRHSEWTTPGHGVHITATSAGPTVVGSVFDSEAHQFGSQRDRLNVTELTPNRRIVYEVTMKNGDMFRHTFDLEPAGTGTRLSKRFESLKLSLASKLLSSIAGAFIAPKLLAGDVERIKARVETPAAV